MPALLAFALFLAGCNSPPEASNMSAEEVADQLSAMAIEPGLWELGTEVLDVRAPDLPREVRNRMIGPRTRLSHCISAEQAARPSANFLAGQANNGCAYQDFTVRDGRLSGRMICPEARARMEGRYGPSAYETRMEMESPMPTGAVMTLIVVARGRRVGPCETKGG